MTLWQPATRINIIPPPPTQHTHCRGITGTALLLPAQGERGGQDCHLREGFWCSPLMHLPEHLLSSFAKTDTEPVCISCRRVCFDMSEVFDSWRLQSCLQESIGASKALLLCSSGVPKAVPTWHAGTAASPPPSHTAPDSLAHKRINVFLLFLHTTVILVVCWGA